MTARFLPLLLITALSGCTGSRWAMDDPDYAAKYSQHTNNVAKTVKQAVDARHLVNKGGAYAALNGRDEPTAMGAEAGVFHYPNPYTEGRIGLAGLIYENDAPVTGGVLAAARVQTPTRLAPFAGIGAYAGLTPETYLTNDDLDNDNDSFIDEDDEAKEDFVVAMVPEAGCHFWLTPGWRLTGSANYYMPSSGREDDFWMVGISLACLTDLGKITSERTLRKHARDNGWHVGDGDRDTPADPPKRVIYVDSEPLSFSNTETASTSVAPQP